MIFVAAAFGADCQDTTSEALDAAAASKAAFEAVDEAGFDLAFGKLNVAIGCVGRVVTPSEALSLHVAFAMGAFSHGDTADTRAHFAAIRLIDPAWRPSASNPTLTALFSGQTDPGTTPARSMPSGKLYIDGTASDVVPAQRAYFAQATAASGSVLYSGMLRSAGELPSFGDDRVVFVKPLGERWYTRASVGVVGGGVWRSNVAVSADWIVEPPAGLVGGGWLAVQVGQKVGGEGHVAGGVGVPFDGHVGAYVPLGPSTVGLGIGARTAALYRYDGADGMLVAFPDLSASLGMKAGTWDVDGTVDFGITAGFLRARAVAMASGPKAGPVVGLDLGVARLAVPKAADVLDLSAGVRLGIGFGDPVRGR
jgi:hypothetical protein